MNGLIKAVAAYKTIDHFVTSADARLRYKSNSENLGYIHERDRQMQQDYETSIAQRERMDAYNRGFQEEQSKLDREHEEYMWEVDNLREDCRQELEQNMRFHELEIQSMLHLNSMDTKKKIAELQAMTAIRNADLDREAALAMHARQLDRNEQLELRRLRVKEQIAAQNEALRKYLFEQGVKSSQEIEHFKALAMRETQILMARENAQNMLQDHLVQEALKSFPLNISPVVLLRNQQHSLTGLLRFSSKLPLSVLPSVTQVYNDVKAYSENPEALNVFIAPIYIDSKIQNREGLSQQIWDSIYQRVESFFTENYNRRGKHPVILYPTAWKDKSAAGQHASETLHFFLKDMPCLVLEPRFDGQSFSMMLSTWGLGYTSSDHVRTEMKFDLNLDTLLIKSAYERSKKSLKVLDELGESVNDVLADKRKELEQNIKYYEMLNLDERFSNGSLDDISAIGVYNLFNIDPVQDMASATDMISSLICVNLAILADVHHLHGTDAVPLFPTQFKKSFPMLYENRELRETVAKCYERVYVYLRAEDASNADGANKREVERVREMQITNLKKSLELIDATELNNTIEGKLRKYATDRFGIKTEDSHELWTLAIERMTADDIPFFQEILPNVEERRRYKQIDRRIAELRRQG